MVMVTVDGIESAARITAGDVETKDAVIKGLGGIYSPHLQVNVTDHRAVGKSRPAVIAGGRENALDVKLIGGHVDMPVPPAPFENGAVSVDFDAVALGIGEIKRLADCVVGSADHPRLRFDRMADPASEIGTGRQKESRVEKPRLTRRTTAGGCIAAQFDQRLTASAEFNRSGIALQQVKTDRLLIEAADGI